MKSPRIILIMIIVLTAGVSVISMPFRRALHPFYKTGEFGFCTLGTFVPYTTNILDAVSFTPIFQDSLFVTTVHGPCQFTVIYKADEGS